MNEADEHKQKFTANLNDIKDSKSLESLRVSALGRKGWVKTLFDQVKKAPPEERKTLAQSLNQLKAFVEQSLEQKQHSIVESELNQQIENDWFDWSMPGVGLPLGALHPLTRIERRCIDVLRLLGFEVAEGPEVETAFHNFDALNIPEHHPARDMQDTFWLENEKLLRSHTSTVQIRVLEEAQSTGRQLPIRVVAPGRVYRNETVDATHLACFHQFEGLWVDKDVRFSHLKGVLSFIVEKIFGQAWEMRFKPKFYPYTEPSLGVDIRLKKTREGAAGQWLTILGAGMVHANVFKNTGFDPSITKGFAFGLGVSRMVTMAHQVESMKSLYETDLRVHHRLG